MSKPAKGRRGQHRHLGQIRWASMTIGQRIRAIRRASGLAQNDLHQMSGVGVQTIIRIENGRDTTLSTLQRLSSTLQVPLPVLIDTSAPLPPTEPLITRHCADPTCPNAIPAERLLTNADYCSARCERRVSDRRVSDRRARARQREALRT